MASKRKRRSPRGNARRREYARSTDKREPPFEHPEATSPPEATNPTEQPLKHPDEKISMDAQQTAETIRGIARRIREESTRMRELVVAVHQSGAVEELVDSIHEASLAT